VTDSGYSLRVERDDHSRPEVRAAWRSLLAESGAPDRVGRSPEYFDHLLGTRAAAELDLVTIRDADGRVVGVVPLRIGPAALAFDAAGRTLWEVGYRAVNILGSRPLLPADAESHDLLFEALLRSFPECGMIRMESVPTEGFLWRYLYSSSLIRGACYVHHPNRVRQCHVIPIPARLDQYLARFRSKRRYNLRRQVRLLRGQCGGQLDLRRVESGDAARELAELFPAPDRGHGRPPWLDCIPRVGSREFLELADRGLILFYLLSCGDRPCAALMGLKYDRIYYLDKVFRDTALDRFSPGATALHLVIEDLIRGGLVDAIDLGFGNPSYRHSATNTLESRATVLLLRRTVANRLVRAGHAAFKSFTGRIKPWVRWAAGRHLG
jgi:CelD/BcsL family acetyltransferase involved in cellulose biosynthesis